MTAYKEMFSPAGFEGSLGVERIKRLVSLLDQRAKTCLEDATATKVSSILAHYWSCCISLKHFNIFYILILMQLPMYIYLVS